MSFDRSDEIQNFVYAGAAIVLTLIVALVPMEVGARQLAKREYLNISPQSTQSFIWSALSLKFMSSIQGKNYFNRLAKKDKKDS